MAINWIWALKAVPWADVVQAAPQIVKGARRLFSSTRADPDAAVVRARPAAGRGDQPTLARIAAIEAALEAVDAEQRASAELIRSLAEQNARLVEAVAILKARSRMLLAVCGALALAMVTLAVWVVTR